MIFISYFFTLHLYCIELFSSEPQIAAIPLALASNTWSGFSVNADVCVCVCERASRSLLTEVSLAGSTGSDHGINMLMLILMRVMSSPLLWERKTSGTERSVGQPDVRSLRTSDRDASLPNTANQWRLMRTLVLDDSAVKG